MKKLQLRDEWIANTAITDFIYEAYRKQVVSATEAMALFMFLRIKMKEADK